MVAFTLAEVLVTLSILGVVAAISIPNLIQNYQKQSTVSRLKMAYSMLDRLTQQSYIENGYPPVSALMNTDNFNSYFGKYLNIAKVCGSTHNNSNVGSGCFKSGKYRLNSGEQAKDENGKDLKKDMFYDLDGNDVSRAGYTPDYYYKVILKNGMSLGVGNLYANAFAFQIVVDIDGPNRGDSKLGQDVFQFTYYAPELMQVGGESLIGGIRADIFFNRCKTPGLLPGAYRPDADCKTLNTTFKNLCSPNATADASAFPNGSGCSGLIIKDGWKISSDYPWNYAHKK